MNRTPRRTSTLLAWTALLLAGGAGVGLYVHWPRPAARPAAVPPVAPTPMEAVDPGPTPAVAGAPAPVALGLPTLRRA